MLKDLSNRMRQLFKAFQKGRIQEMRWISNNCLDYAALHDDKVVASISVLAYTLHKLSGKEHISREPKWQAAKQAILDRMQDAIQCLDRQDFNGFQKSLDKITKSIVSVDESLGNFVQNTYEKAKVKLASSAYANGLSLSQAADLTGADKKQIQSYIGITHIHDEDKYELSIKDRVSNVKKLWGF